MVESQVKELSKEVMLESVVYGHQAMQPVVALLKDFAEEALAHRPEGHAKQYVYGQFHDPALVQMVKEFAEPLLREALLLVVKRERKQAVDRALEASNRRFVDEGGADPAQIKAIFSELEEKVMRRQLVETGRRVDGRDARTIRPVVAEAGILPLTHGSALFTRGETQALVVATLGTSQDEQIIDALDRPEWRQRFMLHYNFPPYSVNEAAPMRAPGRREIGHGKLAWRALQAVMPDKTSFPYTLRLVSEITESNGSSSMATVCGASLAMMDGGVPLKAPVAGIAMGLIKEDDAVVVLSDILGDEDFLGDMDFKVAGTSQGVTALQMDIKIRGITPAIMETALSQAWDGIGHLLGCMALALDRPRVELRETAPTITTFMIPKDKIREVIGSGGKVIREICEVSGAKVDLEDDGTVRIAAVKQSAGDKAKRMIMDIACEPEIGTIYHGTVVKIMEFGAFVNIGSRDGLVHISELASKRVKTVSDVVAEGDKVYVQLVGMERGKLKLSMRTVDQVTGLPLEASESPA
jgi:polyribonucleotide nucleotidyltransferase